MSESLDVNELFEGKHGTGQVGPRTAIAGRVGTRTEGIEFGFKFGAALSGAREFLALGLRQRGAKLCVRVERGGQFGRRPYFLGRQSSIVQVGAENAAGEQAVASGWKMADA